jgi:hypothetical protein
VFASAIPCPPIPNQGGLQCAALNDAQPRQKLKQSSAALMTPATSQPNGETAFAGRRRLQRRPAAGTAW